MTVPRKDAGCETISRYISLEHWQVNVCTAMVIQMQNMWDMFPSLVFQGFRNWLTFALMWASPCLESLPPVPCLCTLHLCEAGCWCQSIFSYCTMFLSAGHRCTRWPWGAMKAAASSCLWHTVLMVCMLVMGMLVWESGSQRLLNLSLLASYVSQDLSLNCPGMHRTLYRKTLVISLMGWCTWDSWHVRGNVSDEKVSDWICKLYLSVFFPQISSSRCEYHVSPFNKLNSK